MKYLKIALSIIVFAALSLGCTKHNPKLDGEPNAGDNSTKEPEEETFLLKVADIIQSHMVVQQGKPFTVWGKAMPGNQIEIKTDWNNSPTMVNADENGNWSGKVEVPSISKGDFTQHEIIVSNKVESILFDDILIGEVWLCSGQSNMHMTLLPSPPAHEGVLDYQNEIANANYSSLRLFKVGLSMSQNPIDTFTGAWNRCTPSTVDTFSAVAYYFGRSLLSNLNIPIGLVESAYGGSSCQAWTSKETIFADPLLKNYYWDKYENSPETNDVIRPSLIYNAMIHPLINFSIKGFIWYQGESNPNDRSFYTRLNTAMIKDWREKFNGKDAPFYFVQMPPYNWKNDDPTAYNYALFREAQEAVLILDNTDMACTMDVGQIDYIHPRNKKPVGERLSKLALYHDYGQKNTICYGPRFLNKEIVEDTVIISFDAASIGSGLTTNDGQPPNHFFIAGNNNTRFYPAHATIYGNKIKLYSEDVKRPSAVRYAFTNYPLTNFGNKEGLPAWPFRTDTW